MKALVVIAHGSRREASNDEVRDLVNSMHQLDGQMFDIIKACFLELAEPSIKDALDSCVELGANDIIVMPYFLSAGTHVSNDIPRELLNVRVKHPNVTIVERPHIGAGSFMAQMLLSAAIRK